MDYAEKKKALIEKHNNLVNGAERMDAEAKALTTTQKTELKEEIALPALGFLLAPRVLGRMMLDPRRVKMLTEGLTAPIKQNIRTGTMETLA